MKAGWVTKALGDVLQKTETDDPARAPLREFDYVDVSSVSNQTFRIEQTQRLAGKDAPSRARRLVRTNDILFATVRPTLRRIAIVPSSLDKQVCSTGYFVLRPKDILDPRFVFYWLFTDAFMASMERLQKGASYPAVTDAEMRAQRIAFPTLPEQRRIVAILDEAFASIAAARAATEKNLCSARLLFVSHLKDLFARYGDGWAMRRVSEIASHSLGKMLDKAKNQGSPKRYLRNLNVRWFEFDLSDLLEMRFREEETSRYTAVKGDVLVCEGGYPGRSAIWEADEPVFFQKALHRIRFREKGHNKWFVYFIYYMDLSGELRSRFSGTGIQHFTGEALSRFTLPIPPSGELERFLARIEELDAESRRLESLYQRKLALLDELKRSLLHKAFSGEL